MEIHAFIANSTWTLEPLPSGKKPIGLNGYSKRNSKQMAPLNDVSLECYKVRLVTKRFTRVEGIDYHGTLPLLQKMTTVRCLLATATTQQWMIIHQLDINSAFFHGDFNEEVYITSPFDYFLKGEMRVCQFQKSLYGLNQTSYNWFYKLTIELLDVGFTQSQALSSPS